MDWGVLCPLYTRWVVDLTCNAKTTPIRWGRSNRSFISCGSGRKVTSPVTCFLISIGQQQRAPLTHHWAAWPLSCTTEQRKDPQRVVRAAEHIVNTSLPPLGDIYAGRLHKKAACVMKSPLDPDITCSHCCPPGGNMNSSKLEQIDK